MKAQESAVGQRVRLRRAFALLAMSLLARTIFGNPPFDSDPSCRAPSNLILAEQARAAARQRTHSKTSLAAAPERRPGLSAELSGIGLRPSLRMRGEVDHDYLLLSSTSLKGPWEPARGFRLSKSETQWLDLRDDEGSTRFYRLLAPTALEMMPLAPNFQLLDLTGKSCELYYYTHRQGIAIIAAGEQLENLSEFVPELNSLHESKELHGTEIWVVLSDAATPRETLRNGAKQLGLRMPVLLDRGLMAANMLGIGRATEAVLVHSPDFVTVYRGAVRDEEHLYLREAILALQSGRPAAVWQTSARTPRLPSLDGTEVRYSQDIAPIFRTYCARCHRPNSAAPFAFTSYSDVQSRAYAIRHQVMSGNMPPWHADPEHGQFKNSLALPSGAKRKLISWLDAGAQRDSAPDPLQNVLTDKPAGDLTSELGEPDAMVKLPVQSIRAMGVEPYRTFPVPAPTATNVWLRAASVIPGNASVVHHYAVYQPLPKELVGEINLGFTFYVPGRPARAYPANTGTYLPASSPLLFELHYTPSGTATLDQPTLNLWFHRERPAKRLTTFTIVNSHFEIPPGEPEHLVSARQQFDHDVTLHSLGCHMHFRGRSMVIETVDSHGLREILLSVPHYRFFWQTPFELAAPKLLPAGTIVEVRGIFDNSPQNLANPDPAATVRWGQQSWEEMFMGVLEISE